MMHVTTELSAYIDQALADGERKRVQEHLSGCTQCRSELEELRAVSRLVAELPRRPLPAGFMQRLERRRRVVEGANSASWRLALPFPARAAAFALSSLFVAFVVYDRAKQAFPVAPSIQGMISGAANDLALPEPKTVEAFKGAARAGAKDAEEPRPSVPLAKALGEPIAGSEPAAARASAPAEADKKKESSVSNEQLQAKLDDEQEKMGIRRVVSPPAKRFGMGQLAGVSGVRGGGGSAGAGFDMSLLRPDNQPAAVGGATPALLAAPSQAAAPAREEGAPTASGFGQIARSAEEQAALWKERELRASPPSVNYAKSMLAVVFGPDPGWAIEIAAVRSSPAKVVILYRLSPLPDEVASQRSTLPYQYRVLTRTDLPVEFERLP